MFKTISLKKPKERKIIGAYQEATGSLWLVFQKNLWKITPHGQPFISTNSLSSLLMCGDSVTPIYEGDTIELEF